MSMDTAQWQLIFTLAGVMLAAVGLLASAGLPILSVTGQMLARIRQRSSYDKCARQLAALGMGMGWLLALAGGVLLWIRTTPISMPDIIQAESVTPLMQGEVLAWITLTCGALAASLYFSLWRTLRTVPVLHQFLGLAGMLCFYLSLYMVMACVAAHAAGDMGETVPATLSALLVPREDAALWNALAYLPPLALAMSGGLGALWLVIRRNRDDYGRDHYMQMLPWCASWARNSWLVLWMLLAGFTGLNLWHVHLAEGRLYGRELIHGAVFLLLWIIPALLWTVVTRSLSPLRHKLTLLLAMVLAMFFVMAVYMGLIGV